ncbi:MAG: LamG domain-containing protein, partial [Thermoguttaceae bacterium]|nr:LamG domain-containing protein [Thermoguttaceae bacterium]
MNRPLHVTHDWVAVGSAVLALLAVIAVPTAAPAVTLPILHYSFDTGTTTGVVNTAVLDRSPSGFNGTIRTVGATPELAGAFNEALYFSGGSFVDVNRALLSTTDSYQPYTISFWMKAASGATGGLVTQYNLAGDSQRFGVGMWAADNGKAQWWSGGTGRTRTTMALDDGNWNHVVFVKNAARQVTVYVNGVNAADPALSNTHPFAFENTNTNIARFSGSVMPFTGYIDEVFIYDQAITQAQAQNLYTINRADPVSTLKIDFGQSGQVIQSGWDDLTRPGSGPATKVFSLDDQLLTLELTDTRTPPAGAPGPHFNTRSGTIAHPIGDVMLDFAYGSSGYDHKLTFKDLDEGTYYMRTYHHDASNNNYGPISIPVTDADGTRQIGTGIPITRTNTVGVFSTVPMTLHANGIDDVVVTISPNANFTHISGLELTRTLPENLLVDMQFSGGATQTGFQPFAHPSDSHSVPQELWFFSDLGVDGSVGVRYSTTSGTITPRNRANVNHEL